MFTTVQSNLTEALFQTFEPISLEALNAKASMLNRLDNKYVISLDTMQELVPDLARDFEVLEIAGTRAFSYETCYFDDTQYSSYFDHHQGRRKRFKVRTRKYSDAGLCFVEVKLKSTRGMTIKKRLPYAPDKHGSLDTQARSFIKASYQELYDDDFRYQFSPVLNMRYKRITLVALAGSERMTIDYDLQFLGNSAAHAIPGDRFIIESKSANANGKADHILRSHHQHPTKACSKYCVGMGMTQPSLKQNRFLPAIKKLTHLEPQIAQG